MITQAQERAEASPVISTVAALLRALGSRGETIVTVDFEAFYSKEFSLSKLTNEEYVRDPRFEVIGVGVKFGAHETVWLEDWDFRRWAKSFDWGRVAVCAHHAQLDALILSHRYGVRPGFLYCTYTMGRALFGVGGNGLDALSEKFGLGRKGDELAETKGKRRADFTQAEWQRFGVYCKNDVDLTAKLLPLLARGFPKLELWIIDSTIRMFTEPQFRADAQVLRTAAANERERKRRLLLSIADRAGLNATEEQRVEAARAVLMSNDKFAALLRTLGEEPPTKISPATGEETYAFAKTDPGFQALLEHPSEEIRTLAEARVGVKSTITETRAERILGVSTRGAVPFYLLAYGAHTGRWSGGDKMNPQNFNRGGELRAAILAPVGHTLVVADSAQIEARVIAWLAGEERLLETFRENDAELDRAHAKAAAQGVDLKNKKQAEAFWERYPGGEPDFYAKLGTTMFFLRPISKTTTPIERQLSKNMALGLGFGMGWAKFATESLKGMLGSKPVQFKLIDAQKFGVDVAAFEARRLGNSTCGDRVRELAPAFRLPYGDMLIHCAVAAHFVGLYRDRNSRIAALWRTCDRLIQSMALEGDEGRMSFMGIQAARHALILPSGRRLRYPALRKDKDGWAYRGGDGGRKWVRLYGAKLCENLVQAEARDIVAEQAMRIRAAGFHLGTLTHDEAVAIVPEERGHEALEFMKATMRVPSEWCPTLPLNADGGVGVCYGNAK